MAKKTVADIDVKGKKVLMRVDFNVPQDDDGNITSDDRIVKALPTIKNVLDRGGALILMSHLGRPEGARDDAYTLKPVAAEALRAARQEGDLRQRLRRAGRQGQGQGPQEPATSCCWRICGSTRKRSSRTRPPRTTPQLREAKDKFAKELAAMADVYVDDAFGTAHRDNASMYTVPAVMEGKPRVIGFLIEKELKFLGDTVKNPQRPFVAILGGNKGLRQDRRHREPDPQGQPHHHRRRHGLHVPQGPGQGHRRQPLRGRLHGQGPVQLLDQATEAGCEVMLPPDHVVVRKLEAGAEHRIAVGDIDPTWQAVDIGPMAAKEYAAKIVNAKTIVWNGPMGVFEIPPFDQGTNAIAQAVAKATEKGAKSVVGGGDSASAIEQLGLQDKISHISTGGGASLEFLEGKKFKAIEILDEK